MYLTRAASSAPGLRLVTHQARLDAASRGQGLVEYALIIVLVALVVFLAVALLGPTISSIFSSIPPAL
jgi:pilus assembly protein Flp/PilA